jgi:hypothetical protein
MNMDHLRMGWGRGDEPNWGRIYVSIEISQQPPPYDYHILIKTSEKSTHLFFKMCSSFRSNYIKILYITILQLYYSYITI